MSRFGVKLGELSFGFLNAFAVRAFVPWIGASSVISQLALCANSRDRRGSKPRLETEDCSSSADSIRAFVPSVDVTAASKRSSVSYCGQRHRRTQAEPDETASADESDADSDFPQSASAWYSDAGSLLASVVSTSAN